jgi:hypothetical protein
VADAFKTEVSDAEACMKCVPTQLLSLPCNVDMCQATKPYHTPRSTLGTLDFGEGP